MEIRNRLVCPRGVGVVSHHHDNGTLRVHLVQLRGQDVRQENATPSDQAPIDGESVN